jgi:hypothetical protein
VVINREVDGASTASFPISIPALTRRWRICALGHTRSRSCPDRELVDER